jgi:hypothetical protein
MGTSFTEYAGFGFWARDGQVEIWLCLLVSQIDKQENATDWKIAARQQFILAGTAGNPGCIWPGLDDLIDSNEKRRWLISLSKNALRELESKGNMIPPDWLISLTSAEGSVGIPVWYTRAVEESYFREYGEKWIRLLEGRFDLKSDPEWNDIVVHDHDFNRQRR